MLAKELHVGNVTPTYKEEGYKMQPCHPGSGGNGVL